MRCSIRYRLDELVKEGYKLKINNIIILKAPSNQQKK